jgi:hypothetical protein
MPIMEATKTRKKRKAARAPLMTSGWRELVHLPDLGLGPIVAKLDTGARSAALHADNLEIYDAADGRRIRFDAYVDDSARHTRQCDLPLASLRRVKNTGGQVEERAVVETRISIAGVAWRAEITLTDRAEMGVPMLLGRNTIKKRFVVHPGRTYVLTGNERKALKTKGRKP